MIVCKFGGTSLADSKAIKNVEKIILSDERRKIIVVSAPGKRDPYDEKITDLLYSASDLASKGISVSPMFDKIRKRFTDIAEDLGVSFGEVSSELDIIESEIQRSGNSDYAASRGEYMNAFIISRYLGWKFIDSSSFIRMNADSTVNDSTYGNGREFFGESGAVIPGFYGMSDFGIKTFPRGGSDITGSIVARIAGAEIYENWTDVSGVMAADPRIIEGARRIDRISFKEMHAFSALGASVFHADAFKPLFGTGIDVNVRNTKDPGNPGTLISERIVDFGPVALSIYRPNNECDEILIIAIGNGMNNPEYMERAVSALREEGIDILRHSEDSDALRIAVPENFSKRALNAVYKALFC